jgi:hypothetical protein
MYKKIGEGTGLVALADPENPKQIVKIPKPGKWTHAQASEKIRLLSEIGQSQSVIAKTRFRESVGVTWRSGRPSIRNLSWKTHHYKGWAFEQIRLFKILEKYPTLQIVDLDQFVQIHHSLWRVGVGFASANELYGMFNKGLDSEGRLLAFDIGSLTSDVKLIRERYQSGSYASKKQQMIHGLAKVNSPELVATYSDYMDTYLNLQMFDRLWRSDKA